ncbi:50S ribosomal protein L31 [Candidatus Microgenomates bacterium]|nr:50S ribosomal protein L31 [Candidatus Microgenomates bacterium]
MKADIHPPYFPQAQVVCACGNTFNVGSTKPEIHVQLCYNCHPFYTGQQRFVDAASLIDKFEKKRREAKPLKTKTAKEEEDSQPKTLKEMLMQIKKQR